GIDRVIGRIELCRVAKVVDVEFERREALLHHTLRPRRTAVRRARGVIAVAAIGVEANAIAELPAKQPVEGLASGLRCNVPERNLDAAQRNEKDPALG